MKIEVNQDLCIGCQTCVANCPESFQTNDEGKSSPISQKEFPCTMKAAVGCPVGAISVTREDE
ncbi:ferredoxin [bacterium]|jgi:ferredoxin|nr:ferredoxin [bacterium]MBT4251633.1 ferredoxin [bacterium]MBT4597682.1 ferredoxin [bacterium]MBT6753695.1 ferredoxin [bacterium]MBT7037832.1 ferredoxin [bacterium]